MGFMGVGSEPLPHQLGGLGERCKFPSIWVRDRENLDFGAFWDLRIQKSRQNGQLAFEPGGSTSESGGTCPIAPT